MTDISKGKALEHFTYKPISLYMEIGYYLPISFLLLIMAIAGAYKFASIEWSATILAAMALLNISAWLYLPRENSLTTFRLYQNGIEVIIHLDNNPVEIWQPRRKAGSYWYSWEELTEVQFMSPKDSRRGITGYRPTGSCRTGFKLVFKDSFTCMAYQRPGSNKKPYQDQYVQFYKSMVTLAKIHMKRKLPIYNRLDIHGKHIDCAELPDYFIDTENLDQN